MEKHIILFTLQKSINITQVTLQLTKRGTTAIVRTYIYSW